MQPDFSQRTIDTLWKRAASMCSNPDCRVITLGPADATGTTNIGEAAHIYGARPGSKRYRADLTDLQRAEITNGLWLCRNCHRMVDADEAKFPVELLFEWRSTHEAHVSSKVGRAGDTLRYALIERELSEFASDTPLAKRIVRDRPPGWEYRLTAELLAAYLKRPLRRWKDLDSGLYSTPRVQVGDEEVIRWFGHMVSEASDITHPCGKLISEEVGRAWGAAGVPGDPHEIRHICRLIGDVAERAADWEERVRFCSVSEPYEHLIRLLPGVVGSQLVKLESMPKMLNEAVDWAELHPEESRTFEHTVVFDLPPEWNASIETELSRISRVLGIDWS